MSTLSLAPDAPPLAADDDGVIRVANTRVTLDTVVSAFAQGATPEEIALRYPSVPLVDVYATIAFYLNHRTEVDTYLEERRSVAENIRTENESRHDPAGVRDRLMNRRVASASS